MALPQSNVLEFNADLGHADNAGAFDPLCPSAGTDKSQGAVIHVYTDLVVDAVTNTKVTSVARSFDSTDVGNSIRITSGVGWTLGLYSIRSVAAGAATLDRSPAAVGTTGGNGRFGGAISLLMYFFNTRSADWAAGNYGWVKECTAKQIFVDPANGTTWNLGGSVIARSVLEGYGTVRGDGQRVTLNGNAARDAPFAVGGSFQTIRNFNMDGFNRNSYLAVGGEHQVVENVFITNVNGDACINTGWRNVFKDCRAYDNVLSGFLMQSSGGNPNQGCLFENCESDTNGSCGWALGDGGFYEMRNCVAHHNGEDAVIILNGQRFGLLMEECTFADNTRDGLRFDGSENIIQGGSLGGKRVERCIFSNNGGYQVNVTASWADYNTAEQDPYYWTHFRHNFFYTTGTGLYNKFRGNVNEDQTLTDDPFIDSTTGDYRLNSTSGGGADVQNYAAHAVDLSGCTTYPNIGAIQVPSTALPSAPTSLSATSPTPTSVDLVWVDNSSNETAFVIERKVTGVGSFAIIASVSANINSYTDTTVSADTSYDYRVYAQNGAGNSAATNTVTIRTAVVAVPELVAPTIDEILFPVDIAEGAVGGPMFSTIVIAAGNGGEQREAQWELGRYKFNIAPGLKNPTQERVLLTFWVNRKGKHRGFRFKDWRDFAATQEALVVDGSPFVQLIKTYDDGLLSYTRSIFKPSGVAYGDAAVTMRRNGGSFTAFSLDLTTGIVTLTADNSQSITGITKAASAVVTVGPAHGFSIGEVVYFSSVAGMTEINGLTGTITGTAATTITVNIDSSGFTTYTSGGTCSQFVQPSEDLDWTGYFHIPMRFDMDDMNMSQDSAALFNWTNVPLIELTGE